MVMTRPLGSRELNDARGPLTSVCVREEKFAMACDGFDVWSFRDSVKFSKPFTFAATSGTVNIIAVTNINFLFIPISFLFTNH